MKEWKIKEKQKWIHIQFFMIETYELLNVFRSVLVNIFSSINQEIRTNQWDFKKKNEFMKMKQNSVKNDKKSSIVKFFFDSNPSLLSNTLFCVSIQQQNNLKKLIQ